MLEAKELMSPRSFHLLRIDLFFYKIMQNNNMSQIKIYPAGINQKDTKTTISGICLAGGNEIEINQV